MRAFGMTRMGNRSRSGWQGWARIRCGGEEVGGLRSGRDLMAGDGWRVARGRAVARRARWREGRPGGHNARMEGLAPTVQEALESYRSRLRDAFGQRLKRLVLLGSVARGEARWDSDVDVLVVLDRVDWRDVAAAVDLAADELTERGVLLSATVLSEGRLDELGRRERRLALDIAREGVPL